MSRRGPAGSVSASEHGPEAAKRLDGDAWPELGDVALQIGADKIRSPGGTARVAVGQEAARESASIPELRLFAGGQLQEVERGELEVRDASGEAFARLAQQLDRGRAQEQKMTDGLVGLNLSVDEPAQHLKQTGCR
jgi:hypothetical protein